MPNQEWQSSLSSIRNRRSITSVTSSTTSRHPLRSSRARASSSSTVPRGEGPRAWSRSSTRERPEACSSSSSTARAFVIPYHDSVKPRIALTLARPSAFHGASHQRYRDALESAGADLLVLHPGDPMPTDLDGLCLSGGGDIESARYGEANVACADVDTDRDALEIAIAKAAIERDLPVLGICRGFQVLNVVQQGSLIQDIPGHRPEEREGVVEHRDVRVRPGSPPPHGHRGAAPPPAHRHHPAA